MNEKEIESKMRELNRTMDRHRKKCKELVPGSSGYRYHMNKWMAARDQWQELHNQLREVG